MSPQMAVCAKVWSARWQKKTKNARRPPACRGASRLISPSTHEVMVAESVRLKFPAFPRQLSAFPFPLLQLRFAISAANYAKTQLRGAPQNTPLLPTPPAKSPAPSLANSVFSRLNPKSPIKNRKSIPPSGGQNTSIRLLHNSPARVRRVSDDDASRD